MAYTRGNSKNIIVGAASLFIYAEGPVNDPNVDNAFPDFVGGESYKDTLATDTAWTNVGYTQNGMELTITPDFGEVEVDQLLDAAKIFKQGMQVTLGTTFAEATLENLLFAIAASPNDLNGGLADMVDGLPDSYSGIRDLPSPTAPGVVVASGEAPATAEASGHFVSGTLDSLDMLEINSGELGECPIERALCAVGPGTGDCAEGAEIERVYAAFRALSMDAVTVSVSRDAASVFDVTFRLLPANNGSYGRIIDRTYSTSTLPVPKASDSEDDPDEVPDNPPAPPEPEPENGGDETPPENGGDDGGGTEPGEEEEQGDAPAVGLMSRTFGKK